MNENLKFDKVWKIALLVAVLCSIVLVFYRQYSSEMTPEKLDRLFLRAIHDDPDAVAELQKAAETGSAAAEYNLGLADIWVGRCDTGIDWLRMAADQGFALAQADLVSNFYWGCGSRLSAEVEQRGQGVNPAEAYYWWLIYVKTCKEYPNLPGRPSGVTDFSVGRGTSGGANVYEDRYKKGLTADQIAEIRKRVDNWKPIIGSSAH